MNAYYLSTMKLLSAYNNFFEKYFPSPLSIALILTLLSFVFALVFSSYEGSVGQHVIALSDYWFAGIFKASLLEFTLHMMLILVLGHIIALSPAAKKLISWALRYCNSTTSSVIMVSVFTILISLFNWGFGLIFGAIFAREIGNKFNGLGKKINYPLVAVAAYVGMMVWHGGLSGSAPIAVAGNAHTYQSQIGVIGFAKTIFSAMNVFNTVLVIIVIPLVFYIIAKKTSNEKVPQIQMFVQEQEMQKGVHPADRLEQSCLVGSIFGALLLVYFVWIAWQKVTLGSSLLSILNLQSTNLLLLGLAFLLQGSIRNFLKAVHDAIGDVSGILIQFPLYFGIMGIIQGSGLALMIADGFTAISNDFTLPVFTFLSAGILNVFIPSGGGQWQVQAPIIIASAEKSNVAIEKLIMAMSYGDQLTNMLQPFWAIPLLTITQLKAKDILPYSLIMFFVGALIFLLSILIF